jgi:two-component system chemotaxis response regulator CheY
MPALEIHLPEQPAPVSNAGQGLGTVMVLEDDPDVRNTVATVLADAGYQVITAENGRAALDRLDGNTEPDLILLDLMMPVLNGFDFLAEVQKHPRWSFIPVIVTSANQGYEAEDLKSFAVLRKPYDLPVLLEQVGRAVELARSARR